MLMGQMDNTLGRKAYEESYHEEQCELGRHRDRVEMLESSGAQGQPYPQLQSTQGQPGICETPSHKSKEAKTWRR